MKRMTARRVSRHFADVGGSSNTKLGVMAGQVAVMHLIGPYRGEIRVTLLNTDARDSYAIQAGDRIAQLVIQQIVRPVFVPVERLPGPHRGEAGFGSSGYRSDPASNEGAL